LKKEINEVSYLLIGDGPIFPQIREKVNRNDWQKDIVMPGRIPHDEVPKYISVFDIAVMPHSNVYGSPMKILEYMAMGKAVLAPRLGPIEDVIQNEVTGLLFEPQNKEDLARNLLKLLSDDRLKAKIGMAARESVIREHNWKQRAQNILQLYENMSKKQS
jgi:glycosyltransferase involved in cell wall biosynthesis